MSYQGRNSNVPNLSSIAGSRKVYVGALNQNSTRDSVWHHFSQSEGLKEVTIIKPGSAIVEFQTSNHAMAAAARLHHSILDGSEIFIREDRVDRGRERYEGKEDRYDRGGSREYRDRDRGYVDTRDRRQSGRDNRYRDRDTRDHSRERERGRDNTDTARVNPDDNTVFVFGLPFAYSWKEVKDMATSHGTVFVSVPKKGYAVIRFDDKDAAVSFINAYNDHVLEGRSLSVRFNKDSQHYVAPNSAPADNGNNGQEVAYDSQPADGTVLASDE